MDLYGGEIDCGDGIPDGDGSMGVSGGIDDDAVETVETRESEGFAIAFASRSPTTSVPIEDANMLTILLPIRIVEISASYLSESLSARAALFLPFSASPFILILLKVLKAVSVAEKYADKTVHTRIMIM